MNRRSANFTRTSFLAFLQQIVLQVFARMHATHIRTAVFLRISFSREIDLSSFIIIRTFSRTSEECAETHGVCTCSALDSAVRESIRNLNVFQRFFRLLEDSQLRLEALSMCIFTPTDSYLSEDIRILHCFNELFQVLRRSCARAHRSAVLSPCCHQLSNASKHDDT